MCAVRVVMGMCCEGVYSVMGVMLPAGKNSSDCH